MNTFAARGRRAGGSFLNDSVHVHLTYATGAYLSRLPRALCNLSLRLLRRAS